MLLIICTSFLLLLLFGLDHEGIAWQLFVGKHTIQLILLLVW